MLIETSGRAGRGGAGGGAGAVRAAVLEWLDEEAEIRGRNGVPVPPVYGVARAALVAGRRCVVPGWLLARPQWRGLLPGWVAARPGDRLLGIVVGPGRAIEWLRGDVPCGRLELFWCLGEDPAAHDAALEARHGPGWWRQHVECCGLVGPS